MTSLGPTQFCRAGSIATLTLFTLWLRLDTRKTPGIPLASSGTSHLLGKCEPPKHPRPRQSMWASDPPLTSLRHVRIQKTLSTPSRTSSPGCSRPARPAGCFRSWAPAAWATQMPGCPPWRGRGVSVCVCVGVPVMVLFKASIGLTKESLRTLWSGEVRACEPS